MIYFAEIGVADKKDEYSFVIRYLFTHDKAKDRKDAAQKAKDFTIKMMRKMVDNDEERMKDFDIHCASAWEKE